MARINIEEQWWEDPRRMLLIGRLGNPYMVDGIWWSIVRQVQLRMKKGESGLLSKKLIAAYPHWEDFVTEGFLEIRGDEFYVAGTDEHMDWLKDRKKTGSEGGKISAQRPRDEKGRLLSKATPRPSKAPLDKSPTSPRPLQASSSSSGSKENTNIHTTGLVDKIKQAWEVWNDTLDSFGIRKTNIAPPQEHSIARAINTLGIENVLLALEGARYERPGDDFRPQDHLTVDRALHKDRFGKSNWERFKNLALSNQGKAVKRHRITTTPLKEYQTNE